MGLQGYQWLIILVIVLLLFGAPKLPKLARSLGQSMRIFKSEVKQMDADKTDSKDTAQSDADKNVVEGRVLDPKEDPSQTGKNDPKAS